MNKSTYFTGQPIFSQLFQLIPRDILLSCVKEYKSDRYYKKFTTLNHLITMLYTCYQHCTSLREVVTGLQACEGRLQSLGMTSFPKRSTFAEANKSRNYEVFEKLYYKLFAKYKDFLPDSQPKDRFHKRVLIIDSTTISLFQEILKNAGRPGVDGRKKGGIKVHMAIKAHEDVPYLIRCTAGSSADAPFMQEVHPPKGSIVIMDKGYNSFHWMNEWQKKGVDWITRLRSRSVIEIVKECEVSEKHKSEGVLSDQHVIMGTKNKKIELVKCRLVHYYDKEKNETFQFITSNKKWSPLRVAMFYKQRWQIEMLFKRLKQNMPLEYFLGDNENAIKIQIFCALIADLLLKVVTTNIKRKWAYSNLASFIRLHLMNYTHLAHFLENPEKCKINYPKKIGQLVLNLSG